MTFPTPRPHDIHSGLLRDPIDTPWRFTFTFPAGYLRLELAANGDRNIQRVYTPFLGYQAQLHTRHQDVGYRLIGYLFKFYRHVVFTDGGSRRRANMLHRALP